MKYHVERSIRIDKGVSAIRPLVENFKKWNSWSPWTIADKNTKMEIAGKAGEVGHSMSWESEIIGSGTNTLVENTAKKVVYDLEFIKPFKSKAVTALMFEKSGKGTKVTWTMDSSLPFFMFFMVDMMKGWISMDYDRGLRMLKEMAEKGKVKAKTENKGVVEIEGFSYVGLERTVAFDDRVAAMKEDFERILKDVVQDGKKSAKHWLTLYPKMDMKKMEMSYIAAVSDEELGDLDLGSDYVTGEVASGSALEISHEGAYDFLGNAWSMGMMYLRAKKMKQGETAFEQYWNSPLEVKPEELKTSVYFPLK